MQMSLILSENTQNEQFREAKFQNFSGEAALDPNFSRSNSELLPPNLLLPMGNNITYLNYTKTFFFFY